MKRQPCKRCGALRLRREMARGACRDRAGCDWVVNILVPQMEAIGVMVMKAMARLGKKAELAKTKPTARRQRS